jgi:hypothetical protein
MSSNGEKRAPPKSPPVTGHSAVEGGSAHAASALHNSSKPTLHGFMAVVAPRLRLARWVFTGPREARFAALSGRSASLV